MFVACSTLCFSREPIEIALRRMAAMEFHKFELAISEASADLPLSAVAENPESALARLRHGPSLVPSGLTLDFGEIDPSGPVYRKRFEALCRFAKVLTVAVVTTRSVPETSDFSTEVQRLRGLASHAMREGLVLSMLTESGMLTGDPGVAAELCRAVPGLGLTLDPSHFVQGAAGTQGFDVVYPFVQNVFLRDTGKEPGDFQVRIGQGVIEYGKILSQLERAGYDRGLTVSVHDAIEGNFEIEGEVRRLKLVLESLL